MKGKFKLETMKNAMKTIFAVLAIAVTIGACKPKTEETATEKDTTATETVAPVEADTTQAPVAGDSTAKQ
ncbi:hypothetical protein D4L85_07620 [Chryseolinea soli]|uniref:Uncharacterized protein n=2 Tax=Chryseolinea soli TaxID=2321403 RepID=A0A385SJ02_9BACT|nr:hypothetical protein D4L85_07620 [Chryseolinea soli]